MLDEKDLQAIAAIMEKQKQDLQQEIRANQKEIKANRSEIKESENRMKAYIENTVGKDIKTVAEGVNTLNDRLPNVDKIQNVQDRLSNAELQIHANTKEIEKLKKAQ